MNGRLTPWLIGVLCATALSLLSYIWVDREGRISALENRVEAIDQAWHTARYALQNKIHEMEYDIRTLKAQVEAKPAPPRPLERKE